MDNKIMDDLYCKGFTLDPNGKKTIYVNGEKIQGQWVEGYYVKLHKTTYCFGNEEPEDNELHQILFEQMTDWNLPNQYYRADIIPDTICHSIGFRDKNNCNIFIGDKIVFYVNNKTKLTGTICYERGSFGVGFDDILNYKKLEKMAQKYTGVDNFWEGVKNDYFLSFWEICWNFTLYDGDRINFMEVIGNKFEKDKV